MENDFKTVKSDITNLHTKVDGIDKKYENELAALKLRVYEPEKSAKWADDTLSEHKKKIDQSEKDILVNKTRHQQS